MFRVYLIYNVYQYNYRVGVGWGILYDVPIAAQLPPYKLKWSDYEAAALLAEICYWTCWIYETNASSCL